jgi:16S rRNA (uracil1498-N3)-methyltransferase
MTAAESEAFTGRYLCVRMAENPLFFYAGTLRAGERLRLPEDTSRHVVQVLRMREREAIQLTDGRGLLADCSITEVSKKGADVLCTETTEKPQPFPALRLAIAFTKNAARNEWLLEKAAELGVQRITPLITERSVREKIRAGRWHNILVSAMLQSRQCWLPQLEEPTALREIFSEKTEAPDFIAHCLTDVPAGYPPDEPVRFLPRLPLLEALKKGQNACICVGPEGDFTPAELTLATSAGAIPVSLGSNRLRTETAALAAITGFYLLNHASAS